MSMTRSALAAALVLVACAGPPEGHGTSGATGERPSPPVADVPAPAEPVSVADAEDGAPRGQVGGSGREHGQDEPAGELVVRGVIDFRPVEKLGGAGGFDQEEVARAIQEHRSAVRRCYERALRNDPTLGGTMTIAFTIHEDGEISGARATENTTGDDGFADCVVGVVRGLRWARGAEGGTASFAYPFTFTPG